MANRKNQNDTYADDEEESEPEYEESPSEDESSDEDEDSAEKPKSKKKKRKGKSKPQADAKEGAWWRAKELDRKPHEILDNVVRQIEDDQASRYEAYKQYERMFGSTSGPDGDAAMSSYNDEELIQNELQNTIETLWAQIFKNRVLPGVSTSEADWDEWDRARSYSRWLEGAFDEALVYEEAFPQAGLHMLTHGIGVIRVGWEESADPDVAKLKAWAVNPKYVLVDRLEAKHGKPRNIYFKDHIDRYKLWDTYCVDSDDCGFYGSAADRRAGINSVTSNDDLEIGTTSLARCDMVTVREAFHLPSSPGASDGRHTIWIRNCTLVDEPFNWDRLPAVFMRFGGRMEGFYGESAVRRLAPTQRLLDKLNVKLDTAQDIMGVPRIIIGNGGAGVKLQHIDDIPGGIIVVDGSTSNVTEWNAQAASAELYADRDSAPSKMRALLGISDFEASSTLPAGLRDVGAPFMEHFVEQGAARHAMNHAEYENAVPALSYLFMLQAEDLQDMGYDVVAKGPTEGSKTSIEELSFADVRVDRQKLKLRVQPMSQLPQSFAGKVEAFEKMKLAGLPIDPKTAMRMMEVPDLAGAQDMMVSDEEIIMKNLSYMTRTGEYLAPMPFDNLDLIVQLTVRYINKYRVRTGRDMNKVALLAQYIDDAISLKKGLGANPNAPPSVSAALGMAGPGMPMGPEGMPPMGPPGPPMAGPLGGGVPPGPMPLPAPSPGVGGPPVVMGPPQQMQVGPPGM